jgi:hypothetical protein
VCLKSLHTLPQPTAGHVCARVCTSTFTARTEKNPRRAVGNFPGPPLKIRSVKSWGWMCCVRSWPWNGRSVQAAGRDRLAARGQFGTNCVARRWRANRVCVRVRCNAAGGNCHGNGAGMRIGAVVGGVTYVRPAEGAVKRRAKGEFGGAWRHRSGG